MRTACRVAPLACFGAAVILASCGSEKKSIAGPDPACSGALPSNVVRITNFAYEPATLHVASGSTVRWVHCGPEVDQHTATADSGSFSSPLIDPGASYSHLFVTADSIAYHCTPHPTMVGTVVVGP